MNGAVGGANLVPGAVMLLAGIGIPVMAALNGQLGARLGNPIAAAAILFAVALAFTLVLLLFRGPPPPAHWQNLPWALFGGGILVAAYVVSITSIGPRIGLANAIFLVLLGQLLASAIIDHFALLGAQHSPLTVQRAVGVALMAIGVGLARHPG